jgi:hypothetical protein
MAKEFRRISFDEFSADPTSVFDFILHDKETVIIERDGSALAVVKPVPPTKSVHRHRRKTAADYEAFRSAAGGWKHVDTDKLIADIYADRRASDQPPIEL